MPVDMGKRTYGGVVDSGKYTLPLYLAFRFAGPAVRLVWERALRKRLYRSFGDYVRGRQPDAAPYAWELLEGVAPPPARSSRASASRYCAPARSSRNAASRRRSRTTAMP
jgi:hypothetical protein